MESTPYSTILAEIGNGLAVSDYAEDYALVRGKYTKWSEAELWMLLELLSYVFKGVYMWVNHASHHKWLLLLLKNCAFFLDRQIYGEKSQNFLNASQYHVKYTPWTSFQTFEKLRKES